MTDNRTTEKLMREFVAVACECEVRDYLISEYAERIEQAIAVTLGSERELIDLAHNAWSMALCAMQGMPIPTEWGDAVERGLRKYGINVDEELAGFEVVDDER